MMDPRKGLRPKVSLVKPDDVPRTAHNRAEKRRLLKALRRLPAPRTGRPWPLQRATGAPDLMLQILYAKLRAAGVTVTETVPEALRATSTGD